ncbi:MAG TPA: DnaT-like ssDNA-binding protein [Planctomycetota bacterium]|jgi:hypothetical protein|nr:DnaT-like ssDNA-binding protein [Planctomycetota bacterium]
MAELNATMSDPGQNSYLTVDQANDRFDAYLNQDAWDDLGSDPDQQAKILMRGSLLIDSYTTSWGEPAVQGQGMAFPRRAIDGVDGPTPSYKIPEEVFRALMAYADYIAENKLIGIKKLQAEGVKSASMLQQNTSFDPDQSELPASSRKELDRLLAKRAPQVFTRLADGSSDPNSFFG